MGVLIQLCMFFLMLFSVIIHGVSLVLTKAFSFFPVKENASQESVFFYKKEKKKSHK